MNITKGYEYLVLFLDVYFPKIPQYICDRAMVETVGKK